MRDPTARSEWRLVHCADCHRNTNHWRIRDRTYRCVECNAVRELDEVEHDRSGLIQAPLPPETGPPRSGHER